MRPSVQTLHHYAPPSAAADAAVGVRPLLPQAVVGKGGEEAGAEEEADHEEDGDLHHLFVCFITLVWIKGSMV